VVDDDDEAELLRRLPDAVVAHVDGAGHSVQGDQPLVLASSWLTSSTDARKPPGARVTISLRPCLCL